MISDLIPADGRADRRCGLDTSAGLLATIRKLMWRKARPPLGPGYHLAMSRRNGPRSGPDAANALTDGRTLRFPLRNISGPPETHLDLGEFAAVLSAKAGPAVGTFVSDAFPEGWSSTGFILRQSESTLPSVMTAGHVVRTWLGAGTRIGQSGHLAHSVRLCTNAPLPHAPSECLCEPILSRYRFTTRPSRPYDLATLFSDDGAAPVAESILVVSASARHERAGRACVVLGYADRSTAREARSEPALAASMAAQHGRRVASVGLILPVLDEDANPDVLHHNCPTTDAFSGAPILSLIAFNNASTIEVLGVHYSGLDASPYNEGTILSMPRPWALR
jgi:hypothetical protein